MHYDLTDTEPLPIKDNTAELIYTSHTIEHVKEKDVERFFREAHRSLKPGGILRVTTGPDAETDFRAMQLGDKRWFYWDEWYEKEGSYEAIYYKPATSVPIEERWLHHFAGPLAPNDKSPSEKKYTATEIRNILEQNTFEQILDFFSGQCVFNPQIPRNHISWWTHTKVIDFLHNAGFQNVYRSGYGQSASPILRNTRLFDSTHPQMSIYVEASKKLK